MAIIKIATRNLVKENAIKEAFTRHIYNFKIIPMKCDSGVANQPVNDDVFTGAKNRLEELKKDSSNYDYLVSCEGGLISQAGHWFNVQVVLIEDKYGNQGWGMSQGYEIPEKYIEEATKTSVADVLDRIFEGKGGIRVLTNGHMTRKNLIHDATLMALGKVRYSDVW